MPFRITVTGFPAQIEAIRGIRNWKLEDHDSKIVGHTVPFARRSVGSDYGTAGEFRVESHDMYEKAGTYAKNTRLAEKCITLITSRLFDRLELGQGELKVKAKATML